MITASMSSAEKAEAYRRLTATITGNDPKRREVKLCYVTVRLVVLILPICLK